MAPFFKNTLLHTTDISEIVSYNNNEGNNELRVSLKGHICVENSTDIPLLANQLFQGVWQDTLDYGTATIGIISDQNSAVNGLKIEYSNDAMNVVQDDRYTITANNGKCFTVNFPNRFIRITYTNGSVNQARFNIQLILRRVPIKNSSHRISDSIIGDDDAELQKSVVTAQDETGSFVNVRAVQGETGYNLKVSIDQIDRATNSVKTIDYSHSKLHSGDHYYYTDHVQLANAGIQNYLFLTPDTPTSIHMIPIFSGSAITQFEIYEATDRVGTTLQIILNNNRNSIKTSTATLHKGYSGGTTDGTRIYLYKSGSSTGSASAIGAGSRSEQEILMKRNTKYIFRLTSSTTDNLTNIGLYWYEHQSLI